MAPRCSRPCAWWHTRGRAALWGASIGPREVLCLFSKINLKSEPPGAPGYRTGGRAHDRLGRCGGQGSSRLKAFQFHKPQHGPSAAPSPGYVRAGRRPGGPSREAHEPCSRCPRSPLLTGTDTLRRQARGHVTTRGSGGLAPTSGSGHSGPPYPRRVTSYHRVVNGMSVDSTKFKGNRKVQAARPGGRPALSLLRPRLPGPGPPPSLHPHTDCGFARRKAKWGGPDDPRGQT